MGLMYRFPRLYNFLMLSPILDIHYQTQLNLIARVVGKNKKVFDLACGTGLLSNFLDKSCVYSGIDLNKNFINFAGSNGLNVEFGNIFDEKFYPKNVDFIVISHVLHHIHPDEEKLLKIAKKHAKKVIVIEGVIQNKISYIWNKLAGKFKFIFDIFGDNDGVNIQTNIQKGLLENSEARLKKLFELFNGKIQKIPGGLLVIIN